MTARAGESGLFETGSRREAFTRGVLRWLTENLDQFRPPREDEVDASSPETIARGAARKAFGELGAALRVAHRAPALRARPDVQRLTAGWVEMARSQKVFFEVGDRLGLFSHHVALHVVLSELHPPACPSIRAQLQRVLARGYVDRIERTAWNQLDLRYFFDAAGLNHDLPPLESLLTASSLALRPELPYARPADLYAITHILFDLAAFGDADPRLPLGELQTGVIAYLQLALSMCLAEQDWDLTAEFLMCRLYLRSVGPLDRAALRRLCEVQDASGFLPRSTGGDPSGDGGPRDGFQSVYHPTVVGLFLAAAEARAC